MFLVFCRHLKWSRRLIAVIWLALQLFTMTGQKFCFIFLNYASVINFFPCNKYLPNTFCWSRWSTYSSVFVCVCALTLTFEVSYFFDLIIDMLVHCDAYTPCFKKAMTPWFLKITNSKMNYVTYFLHRMPRKCLRKFFFINLHTMHVKNCSCTSTLRKEYDFYYWNHWQINALTILSYHFDASMNHSVKRVHFSFFSCTFCKWKYSEILHLM